jgi:hypothetical protein
MSSWILLASIPNPVMINCDRRERAQFNMGVSLISFPDCLPHCPGISFSKLSLPFFLRGSIFLGGATDYLFVDVKRGRNKIYKNYFLWLD